VFGTDTYTQNSSICSAAVHSGKYKTEGGAAVEIVMKAGAEKYVGSEKNGVTSMDFGKYDASFTVKGVKPIDG
jgi:hypothetical protein